MTKELRRLSIVCWRCSWPVRLDEHHPGRPGQLVDQHHRQHACAVRLVPDPARIDHRRRHRDRLIGSLERRLQLQRQYTDADMWAPVTGYMNPVLDAKTQIEAAENSVLSGSDSNQFFSRIDRAITGQAPRGSNVELSRSTRTCRRPRGTPSATCRAPSWRSSPRPGASWRWCPSPATTPNILASHDTDAVNAAYDQLSPTRRSRWTNRAIGGNLNPPGSTFKLVVASAALASGRYTPTRPSRTSPRTRCPSPRTS